MGSSFLLLQKQEFVCHDMLKVDFLKLDILKVEALLRFHSAFEGRHVEGWACPSIHVLHLITDLLAYVQQARSVSFGR